MLDGGDGQDVASFAYWPYEVSAVSTSSAVLQSPGFGPHSVSLSNLEDLTGSDQDDTLTGDDGANVLDGGDGNDTIDGKGGIDSCIGGAGTNTFANCETTS